MKTFRLVFSIVAWFLIVLALAVGALSFVMNPNHLKPLIISQVKNQTGYEMEVSGPVSWFFYPQMGIKIAHITLHEQNQPKAFLELDKVKILTSLSDFFFNTNEAIVIAENARWLNLEMHKLQATLNWHQQSVIFQPITANLYQGHLVGNIQAQFQTGISHWNWEFQLTNAQMEPLSKALWQTDRLILSGTGQLTGRGEGENFDEPQPFAQVNGTITMNVEKGALQGLDIKKLLFAEESLLKKQSGIDETNKNQTAMDHLQANLIIKNGILEFKKVEIQNAAWQARVEGGINLTDQTLNLHLYVTEKEVFGDKEIPILINGNLAYPQAELEAPPVREVTAMSATIKKTVPNKTTQFVKSLLN